MAENWYMAINDPDEYEWWYAGDPTTPPSDYETWVSKHHLWDDLMLLLDNVEFDNIPF